jgi:hypothetical protein
MSSFSFVLLNFELVKQQAEMRALQANRESIVATNEGPDLSVNLKIQTHETTCEDCFGSSFAKFL